LAFQFHNFGAFAKANASTPVFLPKTPTFNAGNRQTHQRYERQNFKSPISATRAIGTAPRTIDQTVDV
jgi:hypothetical protein